MWERTLQDLIRGLRANKKDETKFIAEAVDEIRKEIKGKDMELKAGAALKLTYLEMLGYDMAWASFHVVEVMSSSRHHLKAIGYLAAVQSFVQDTDVLMLTTNLLKKDLNSTPADIAVTLNGLSQIVTPDLARDLSPDVLSLLNHSRPHIRKRAIVTLYKMMLKYPEFPETGMMRLREKLEDPDPGVVAAVVNVICELARQKPQDCLVLAPPLFHLLTTSANNWMLIKIVKLFGSLTPHEPRLVKKLQPPLTDLISNTPAISLLYECVHTAIIGGMLQGSSGDALARMCVSKLAAFIEDEDQNLKYYALLAMEGIVPSHPHLIAQYQDMIMSSIGDEDMSIRLRALDLLSAMVDQQNIQDIIQQFLSHLVQPVASTQLTAAQSLAQHALGTSSSLVRPRLSPSQSPAYRLLLARRILTICSQGMYENVTNFEWYLSVLVDLTHVAGVDVGSDIHDKLIDITVRVKGARRFAVQLMCTLLKDATMLEKSGEEGSCLEVLRAAAWICGEYCSQLAEPQQLIPYLLKPEITRLAPETQAVYVHAVMKIFGFWAAELAERWNDDHLPQVKELVSMILARLKDLASSPHIEVQERSANALQLFTFIQADLNTYQPRPQNGFGVPDAATSAFGGGLVEPAFPKSLYLLRPLFTLYELNPVAPNAQASVPVPEGLDLDTWIVPPPTEPPIDIWESDGKKVKKSKKGKARDTNGSSGKSGKKKRREEADVVPTLIRPPEEDLEAERAERERRKAERLEQMRDDPYYIVDDRPSKTAVGDDIDSIPVVHLSDLPLLPKEPDKPQLVSLHSQSSTLQRFVVDKDGEMPLSSSSVPTSRPQTPLNLHPTSSVQSGDDFRPRTPDPIKITKVKKKGASSGKKTRTLKFTDDDTG